MTSRTELFSLRVYHLSFTPLSSFDSLYCHCCITRGISVVQYQAREILSRRCRCSGARRVTGGDGSHD